MKIYLDVCCLNRPFDDQSQERIRLEAEAVALILKRIQAGSWKWISSPVVTAEIRQTPDEARRQAMLVLTKQVDEEITMTPATASRARELAAMGFKPFDAAHLACAETGADIFLTMDDRLLRTAKRQADRLQVQTANPLLWLQEML
ncbi:MAG: type II toxin-antitoxin system VapC family toxin [Anaerolineae bacterium]